MKKVDNLNTYAEELFNTKKEPFIKKAQNLSDIIEQISSSSATIETYKNDGTGEIGAGFFILPRIMLTASHVVGITPQDTNPNLKAIVVTTKDGNRHYASVIDYDANLDAAVLYVNIPRNTRQYFLNLGNSGTLKVGQGIVTIGSPLGYSGTASYGIISKVDLDENKNYFLIDANVNPGSSGGLIFSLEKQAVIGIAVAVLNAKEVSSQGLSVGIGIDPIKNILKRNKIKFIYKEQQND